MGRDAEQDLRVDLAVICNGARRARIDRVDPFLEGLPLCCGDEVGLRQHDPVGHGKLLHGLEILVERTRAGGGIGPSRDVVAFNYHCTHQGGDLTGTYKADTKSLGACPLHLSTYDLTRHGILISGQAYQSLPQVMLEVEGDNIYAVGVLGLLFGRNDNLTSA